VDSPSVTTRLWELFVLVLQELYRRLLAEQLELQGFARFWRGWLLRNQFDSLFSAPAAVIDDLISSSVQKEENR